MYILQMQPQIFKINDAPVLTGVVYNTKENNLDSVAFVSFRITRLGSTEILLESLAVQNGYYFSVSLPKQENINAGVLLARVYNRSSMVATIDGDYTDTDTSINITTADIIPDLGFAKIGNEIVSFTKGSSSSITIARAKLQTVASAVSAGAEIIFSENNETIGNTVDFEVQSDL